jgi:hypothetical protein
MPKPHDFVETSKSCQPKTQDERHTTHKTSSLGAIHFFSSVLSVVVNMDIFPKAFESMFTILNSSRSNEVADSQSIRTMAALAILMLAGCSQGFGTRLEFNGGELYYTATVTPAEAQKLGQYLIKEKFFDGTPKSVQLNKNKSTYEFRFVVKKGLDTDPSFVDLAKVFCKELSEDVFEGSPVETHFCDDQLRTLRIVIATE